MKTYTNPVYPYVRPGELDSPGARRPVVVVGAGPVGLTAAIDLALHRIPVVVLDEDCTVSVGSRAICYAKRALEILDRLGCGQPIVDKGIGWNVGKVFFRDELVYRFDLLPEPGHRRPAFVNLQQYWLEEFLVNRASELDGIELRWQNKVTGVVPHEDRVDVKVTTTDGEYRIECDWLIVADGSRSPVRRMLGLEAEGQVFHDRFLIADIYMTSSFPTERWFWFDPPFHRNQSALLHRQADDVWRIDFQLGWDADPEVEKRPERIVPRLKAMLGNDTEFEIEWASVYTFQCRRMQRFRHGRVIFAGDAAHVVSPFGARGANSGIQDTDNLVWKLALVVDGRAPERLLDSYDAERTLAADENILNSTRSTDFITPKSSVSRTFRDAVLSLAKHYAFARRLVNSGRLSVPSILASSPLNSDDHDADFARNSGAMIPGAPAADAPVEGPSGPWLLGYLGGTFTLLAFDAALDPSDVESLARDRIGCGGVHVGGSTHPGAVQLDDVQGLARRRYDARPGTVYLIRPDQHVCARWRAFDLDRVRAAIARATCNG
ncbi:MAG TPA: FAD-dependent oxidoreductase [Casimicrobiaceae bacterium]|nr:FAD-dependent oxidoreductase [Casimicrobiaceae bacterium]